MNSQNVLLTKDALLKENFNSYKIETKTVEEFLLYFVAILKIGIKNNLIDEQLMEFIVKKITMAINQLIETDEDDEFANIDAQIANFMYVITLYLKEKENWDAYNELIDITSVEKAKELAKKAKLWIQKKLKTQLVKLSLIKSQVDKINQKNVSDCFESMVAYVKKFISFDSINQNFDLKYFHIAAIEFEVSYCLLKEAKKDNVYDRICENIKNFSIEVAIMSKIDAKTFFDRKKVESDESEDLKEKEINSIDMLYEEKLKSLKTEIDERMHNYLDALHKKGRKKKGCSDEVEIMQEWDLRKRAIESEWIREIEEVSYKHEVSRAYQMEILAKEYTLYDLIKEFAIFSLAEKGKIEYPDTLEKKGVMLRNISFEIAVDEFIEFNKHLLDNEEICYLKSCK